MQPNEMVELMVEAEELELKRELEYSEAGIMQRMALEEPRELLLH